MKKFLLSLVVLILLFGCSSNKPNQTDGDYPVDYYEPSEEVAYEVDYKDVSSPGDYDDGNSSGRVDPTKMIRTGQFSIETRTFDDDLKTLQNNVTQFEGFVENSSVSKNSYRSDIRVATYRLRIPSDKFDGFVDAMKSQFTIISESTQNVSVADRYYDTENRIKVLKVQQDRLLELVDKAETIEEIVYLQDHLMRIEEDLEYNQGTLKKLDDEIEYSTISLTILELEETQPSADQENFFTEISRAFSRGMNNLGASVGNFVLNIVENIVPIVLILIALVVGVRWFNKHRKITPEDSEK